MAGLSLVQAAMVWSRSLLGDERAGHVDVVLSWVLKVSCYVDMGQGT
jgi:hypothetical protein